MKKLIITIFILLIILLTFIVIIKGIKIGGFSIKGYKDIKTSSLKLDEDLTKATKLTGVTYPQDVKALQTSITKFQNLKAEYESKIEYSNQASTIVLSEIEKYEIEFLWTIIGNYASAEGINLTLDIVEGTGQDVYNLNFKLTGSYVGMTDFIYDLENDERLNFKIEGLKMDLIKVVVEEDGTIVNTASTTNINTNTTTNTAIKTNTTNNTTTNTTANKKLTSKQKTVEMLQTVFSVNNISINLKNNTNI